MDLPQTTIHGAMKEVLIISYFYPPCTLTAAQRPAGWVKYLSSFGFKPIVVTRNWEVALTQPEDQLRDSGKEVVVETTDSFEIHYLPYRATVRDRLFNSTNRLLKKSSKIFTFIESIGENYSNRFIPFRNLFDYSEKLIEQHTFSALIITGNPFVQFRFGYLLNKKYKIPWIADYRDDWTTSEIIQPKGKLSRFLHSIQQQSEQKWVGTSSLVTSVSEVYTDRISEFVTVPGATILNGFDALLPKIVNDDFTTFKITYNGTLYDTQDIETFIRVVIRCIEVYSEKIKIQVQFPGLAYDSCQEKRVKKLILGYDSFFLITARIPKSEVLILQQTSDFLLMLTHSEKKGIPSSKLYEYLSIQRPIICFPSDGDIVAYTIKDTGAGIIIDTEEYLMDYLNESILSKLHRNEAVIEVDVNKLSAYSQYHQVSKLSAILTEIGI